MLISYVGQKGGAGKSTLAGMTAAEWVRRKRKVLLVDADPQRSVSTWRAVSEKLGETERFPEVLTLDIDVSVKRLQQTFMELLERAAEVDVVVIDCAGRNDAVQRAALWVSSIALFPWEPSPLDGWALSASWQTFQVAKELERGSREPLKGAVIVNQFQPSTRMGQEALEILSRAGVTALESKVGHRVAFKEAPAAGLGVTVYQPRGLAAKEVRTLVDEIEVFAGMRKKKTTTAKPKKTKKRE